MFPFRIVIEVENCPADSLELQMKNLQEAGKETGVTVDYPHEIRKYFTWRGRRAAFTTLAHADSQEELLRFAATIEVVPG